MRSFLYFSNENCSVCVADRARIQALAETLQLPLREATPADRGRYLVFSAPTILLLDEGGNEIHRESGFVNFERLKSEAERI
jgi:hypothetical protein